MAGGSRCLSNGASSSSNSAAQGAQVVPSGLQIARLILKQEGLLGLYRGFGMSVATFVPSSAVWWSAYGVYQQLVARAYTSTFKATPSTLSSTSPGPGAQAQHGLGHVPAPQSSFGNSSSSSSSSQCGAVGVNASAADLQSRTEGDRGLVPAGAQSSPSHGALQASGTQASHQQLWQQQQQQQQHTGGAGGGLLSTSEIMVIQTGSSMLAGATSSLITNPLDLIKTRIQVAHRHEGQPATFRSVITEIIAEDGPFGLFRGVLPRMANAALWGTCMVTVYEFLRRASRKEPDQE